VSRSVLLVQVLALMVLAACSSSSAVAAPSPSPQDLRPYQALVAKDYTTTVASASAHCFTIHDQGCKAAYDRVRANLEIWLNDMSSFTPPSRFKQLDAMLRRHLAQAVVEGDAGIAAQQAANPTLFDAALNAHFNERRFVDAIADAVANTRVVAASGYKLDVEDRIDQFTACTPCGELGGSAAVNCSGPELLNCVYDVVVTDTSVFEFEATLARGAAPPSLAIQDAALQGDLVSADAALTAMITAGLSRDQYAFESARASLQVSASAIKVDAKGVSRA